ncbi:MAG TPA: ATP-binding protein [Candidatus Angelobacter sp.]|nr:ATP-binding protein [Candidatus Angelobacter sp.]
MPESLPSEEVSIRSVLLLGFLAAITPTALLIAYRDDSSPTWYRPTAYAVICVATAVLSLIIARWLGKEAAMSQHPALAVLSGGFAGMTLICIVESFIRDPVHLITLRTASMAWMLMFGGCALILLNAQGLRRYWRHILLQGSLVFYSRFGLLFGALCLGALLLDRRLLHSEAYAPAVQMSTLLFSSAVISVLLISTFRLYQRKRNTVILFFSLGLYLYTLGILAQTAGPHWSLLWWFGHALSLISIFIVAYGILEANRVRDRLQLVETLAARSEEIDRSHLDLARSESQYRSLVNNAPYGIFRFNESGRFEAVNPALVEILGYDSAQLLVQLGSYVELFQESNEHQSVMDELQRTGYVVDEVFWQRKDGKPLKVRLQCRKVTGESFDTPSYEGIVEDLSEQSSLEEQLRQSQKMEAIGRLAGGIAHDFNNLLTVINGYTGMLIETLSPKDPRRADAERVKTASERAAALTRQLLAFSRKQVLTPITLNLNSVVSDLSRMLPRLIGEDIDMAFMPGEQLSSIFADRGQVEQVLMNLIVNARDAMPHGGKITVETNNKKLDEKYTRHRRGVVPGEYVMLAVTDTGTGMDAAIQAQIFEPFFTTKEEGKGTGLGLATVYGIVKQSGGHIAVYSEPGQGTTFRIYFPATSASKKLDREPVLTPYRAKGETVLVIEDEADLRNMIVRALRRREYHVLEARTGEEALELVQNHEDAVQLLITDIVMPGMRGTEAAQRLADVVPDLKILYMSGYTDSAMFHQKLLETGSIFLQKPFTVSALEEKVQKALQKKDDQKKARRAGSRA